MTLPPDDELGELLRRALHAEADSVEPSSDGLEIIRTRIDEFGVEEPLIQKVGRDRIIVELAGITDEERRTILELVAKGSYGALTLATDDLDGLFERLQASGADVVQEPMDQPYGVRDCAFRDPAGNLLRINAR